MLSLKAGQVQVLHNTYTIQGMKTEGDEGNKRGVKLLHKKLHELSYISVNVRSEEKHEKMVQFMTNRT